MIFDLVHQEVVLFFDCKIQNLDFLKILDIMGLEFSYLDEEDVATERTW